MKISPWHMVVKALVAEGVERVFGLSGNPTHLVDDLARHSKIQNVLVRHEHSGAACAYAHARVTGRPAVCYASPGPGTTNLVTALLEATSGSLPVIALSNGVPTGSDGKGAFQELDTVPMMRPVTKWATRIVAPETTPWVMQRAFSIAKNGRPGAVFIDIPSDLALQAVTMPAYQPSLPRHRSRPERQAVAAAAKLLAGARQPLALCGSGAVSAGAFTQIRDLAEKLGMPVFTTPGGRGVFPEDHDLALGQVGLYFTEAGRRYFDDADVVLAVGSRLEDFSTGSWKLWPRKARFIQIDIQPEAMAMNLRPDVALLGDAALALEDLAGVLNGHILTARLAREKTVAVARNKMLNRVAREVAKQAQPILSRQVVGAINRIFGRNTVMVHENGGADLWTYYWPYYQVLDTGDCVPMAEQTAMGMGVIGAIAVKMALPEKKVVCVTGDGAMQMAMMELATAAEQKCGVTWVVLNNRSLGWPQYIQKLEGQAEVATNFEVSPDFAKLAKAQGCRGIKVTDPAKMDAALKAAVRANRQDQPVLIDVQIAKHDYIPHFTDYHREIWGYGKRVAPAKKKRKKASPRTV
jgi:acetolactate synthase-1/2/3 large subunit